MKKKMYRAGVCALLAVGLLVANGPAPFITSHSAYAADTAQAQTEAKTIKGKITNISQKAKTIALANKDTGFFLVKFSDDTELKGIASSKELKADEAVVVQYVADGDEFLAKSIEKALVKLPKGIKEIKTDELAEKVKNSSDKIVVVDARPPIKYAEGHIAGAVSIPFSKLTKMGDDGAKLLEKYKDRQLIFYCGGST